jgi:uncharacterized NAD(P)/FAD-binding protein YdhS
VRRVVIIGGGFSGVSLAVHLEGGAHVTVVEPGLPGQGPAYRARSQALKLNAPAQRMSVDPASPLDFVQFLEQRGLDAAGFVPRAWFADYLGERFAQSGATHLRATAVDVSAHGEVTLSTGQTLQADAVVLATGNTTPSPPNSLVGTRNVVVDPWDEDALARLPREARVLLLGTGLTALDVALLLKRAGHKAEVLALSRSGRWPCPHLEHDAPELEVDPATLPATARALTRWAREAAREAPWQKVVDALRRHAQPAWERLPVVERRRLLRVALPAWNRHRHRAPVELLEELEGFAPLTRRRGRALALDATGPTIAATLEVDGVGLARQFDALVLCTGPSLRTPLLTRLESAGLVRFEPLEFGVTALVPRLHVLGPLDRWRAFEATAVAELATHAQSLAHTLRGAP